MAVYLVERDLPGVLIEHFVRSQNVVIRVSRQFTAAGKPIRYLRSTCVPSESRYACLFEAADPVTVREVNDTAGLSYTRVVEVLDLTP